MIRPDHHDRNALDNMKLCKRYCSHKFIMNSCYEEDATEMRSLEINYMLRIRLREAGSNEEIFTFVVWIRAFNINEPIYVELCHEFYLTYEFDKVGTNQAVELEEEGFNVYFKGGLRSDEHFNAQEHQNGYVNVAWLIARWMKRKGVATQKESQISCGQFISKIAKKSRVLTDDVLRSLSALIYYRDLDTTTLKDLIDFEGKLIPKDPQPGVLRVGIPRPLRAFM
nr:hypothetical protein [Tanacetum cinerariifolium]